MPRLQVEGFGGTVPELRLLLEDFVAQHIDERSEEWGGNPAGSPVGRGRSPLTIVERSEQTGGEPAGLPVGRAKPAPDPTIGEVRRGRRPLRTSPTVKLIATR